MKYINLIKNKFLLMLTTLYFTVFLNPIFAFAEENIKDNFSAFASEYKYYIAIFVAIGVLTGILGFIVNFIKLGKNASNPRGRSEAIHNLLICGFTTGLLLNIGFLIGFYYKIVLG